MTTKSCRRRQSSSGFERMPADSQLQHRLGRILHLFFNREVIVYILVGILTTLVNLAVFTALSSYFGNDGWWISKFPAIILAILFAFFANRMIVFRSHGPILQEMYAFFISRIFVSLVFEYGAMFVLYELFRLKGNVHVLRWDLSIANLLTQVLVIVGNYVLSKWFIFNQPRKS